MDYSIRLNNGLMLKGRIVSPGEHLRAVVVLIHGHGEHIGRYDGICDLLIKENIGFTGMDLPGHGLSEGKRGHIKDFLLFHEMIDILLNECRKTFPGIPLILYGHSLGGLIATHYILVRKPEIKAAIITSPLFRLAFEPGTLKIVLAAIMKHIAPGITQSSGLPVEYISHDAAEVEKYKKDPLIHDKTSVSLFYGIRNSGKYCMSHANELSVPMLLMHGSDDKITLADASREFASRTKFAELKIWENGYHELHNETFRENYLNSILEWIKNQLG